jgi:hypothetical protein
MLKNLGKPLILFFLITVFYTCIDPFSPLLKESESLLVVDAQITNENRSYQVKLSRTDINQMADPIMVTDAFVTVRDDDGNVSVFSESTDGVYNTNSLLFTGETGKTYILNIKTTEGDEYESEPCLMYPVQTITSIYYNKEQEIINNGTETEIGLRFYLDSQTSGENQYFRWIYNECWKTNASDPKKYNYINDSTIIPVDQIKQICWRYNESDNIIIQSALSGITDKIEKQPLLFIAPAKSDRLLIRYSVEIKQLSLSPQEYEFWDHMKQIDEAGGDIFEKQPFPISSNIHNLANPEEKVLGYFQVSAVDKKRIYINPGEIKDFKLPVYNYDCHRLVIGEDDYSSGKVTFNQINSSFEGPNYTFVEPIYNSSNELFKLVFSRPVCADCTINGTLAKPDFWID